MPIVKSKGNMYPWVTHCHTHLRGKCPHGCRYCYVQAMAQRFPATKAMYSGLPRLDEKELLINYHSGRTYFIEHQNDLFAESIPRTWIKAVLGHCKRYPGNTYVFQSKNAYNMVASLVYFGAPPDVIIGTTAESDVIEDGIYDPEAKIESPLLRLSSMFFEPEKFRKFVTVEPIMRMKDPVAFARAIAMCKPEWVNIGADSKCRGLPEPSKEQLVEFITALKTLGIEIWRKTNLERLME